MENSSLLENEWSDNHTERKEIDNDIQNCDSTLVAERCQRSPPPEERDNRVTRRITQRSCADLEIIQNLPDLPTGKDKYFFVSYSSDDGDRVWSIVKDLEDRFKLPCVYAKRDFKPGRNTQDCIKEGMARSFKVLMFLTPNFHQSGWCYQEREYAFNCSIESRSNYIIPVKLEQCEIPSALTPLTYVDATDTRSDIPAKIATALIETEIFEPEKFLPREFTSSIKKYENGYSVSVVGDRDKTCIPCRPAKYNIKPSVDLFKKLRIHNVKIPKHLLVQTIKFINSSSIMSCYDFREKRNLCCWWICTFPGVFVTIYTIFTVVLLSSYSGTRLSDAELNRVKFFWVLLFLLTLIVIPAALLFVMCFIPCCCRRMKWNISLQRKIWDKFGDEFIINGVLLIFSESENRRPKLIFMRYNFIKCKDYLKSVIMENHPSIQEQYAETYALSCIKRYVREILPLLADNFDSLADAPYNRHDVRKGKMCLCQHLELEV